MQDPFWTLRLFGLGRPFGDLDVDATLQGIAGLVGEPVQSIRYALPGEGGSRPVGDGGDVGGSLPDWRGCLTLTGRTASGVDMAIDLWRLDRASGVNPKASGYRCHQLMLDFPSRISLADALESVVHIADAFGTTYGVVCPRGYAGVRQNYRERGLTEGIPAMLHVTLLGGAFRAVVDERALAENCMNRPVHPGKATLVVPLIDDWTDALTTGQVEMAKAMIGHQYFAGERQPDQSASGSFGFLEILREGMRMVAADRRARRRSSPHRFDLDWSGLFVVA